ncbi:MAG: hydantoinase/oxoprolinase family protein [Betaproteobacteria bacterium]|nr:hydantoinase/oxoprolinase family protein [Betaproteobacteria bacterium]
MTYTQKDHADAPTNPRTLRIGLDVGGTFTDLYMLDEANGRSTRHKLPSTPQDPYRAPIQGLREIIEMVAATPDQVRFVGLGTTVATNALLERKGALTGLITTKGFRDLLEIGRQTRPHVYDYRAHKPAPLVSRELRLEVEERVAADGSIITPLNEKDVSDALQRLAAAGVKSIAVCFLNSYANANHEARVARMARDVCPEIFVTTSQELIPELREYERLTATVINAYLAPTMKAYLSRFAEEVRTLGIPETPFVMSRVAAWSLRNWPSPVRSTCSCRGRAAA